MKKIINSKSARIFTYAFMLITILLLSLIVVTTIWAKPNNPNKPDNPGEHDSDPGADFKIWIGNGDLGSPEDVVLRHYGNPEMGYLLKEAWPYGTRGWLPSTKNGKGQNGGDWHIILYQEMPPGNTQDYCGTYDIANKLGGPGYEEVALFDTMVAHGYSSDLELFGFYLYHITPKPGKVVGDYWDLHMGWKVDSGGLWLGGCTNKDTELEGIYNQKTDTWTIPFDSVWFELVISINDVQTTLWEGQLSFTIEIQRTLK